MKPFSLVSPSHIQDMIEVAAMTPPGCFVEVGVYKGGTAYYLDDLAAAQRRDCFLYDTFNGIPYKSEFDHHDVGDFGDTDFEEVTRKMVNSTVVKGIFPDSAVKMGPVAFVHLDCDQYQSIKDACRYLEPMIVPGGVIWFDDSPLLAGAEKAVMELYADRVLIKDVKHYVIF